MDVNVWPVLEEFREEAGRGWKYIGDLASLLSNIALRFEVTVELLKLSSTPDIVGEIVKSLEAIQREIDEMRGVGVAGSHKAGRLWDVEGLSKNWYKPYHLLSLAREVERAVRKYYEARSGLEVSALSFFKAAQSLLSSLLSAAGAELARYSAVQLTLSIIYRAAQATRHGLEELKGLGERIAEILAVVMALLAGQKMVNADSIKGLDIGSLATSEAQKICTQAEQLVKSRFSGYPTGVDISTNLILEIYNNMRDLFSADLEALEKRLSEAAAKAVVGSPPSRGG